LTRERRPRADIVGKREAEDKKREPGTGNREQKLRGGSVPGSLFPVPSIPDFRLPIPD